jgi:hypothetical protein
LARKRDRFAIPLVDANPIRRDLPRAILARDNPNELDIRK